MRRSCHRVPTGAFATLAIAAVSLGIACFDFGGYSLQGYGGAGAGPDADVPDSDLPCTPPVEGGECGTFPQCGCLPMLACDVSDTSGHTKCVVDQGRKLGALCDQLFSGCSVGLTCVDQTCKKFCMSTRNCDNGGGCIQVRFKSGDAYYDIPNMKVCTDQCDFMRPDQICDLGATCVPALPVLGVQPGYSVCKLSKVTEPNCEQSEDCSPGKGCGEDHQCHSWCKANLPLACPPLQKCKPFKVNDVYGYYYVGEEPFGLCLQ